MSLGANLAIGFVSLLLVATLLAQHREWGRKIADWDPLRLVPRWTFFAPSPVFHDTNLVVREVNEAGVEGPWLAVDVSGERRAFHVAWNPNKRVHKMIMDLTHFLMTLRAMPHVGEHGCPTTLPYLLILHFCLTSIRARPGQRYEFGIVRTSGRGERRMWLVYRSGLHAL